MGEPLLKQVAIVKSSSHIYQSLDVLTDILSSEKGLAILYASLDQHGLEFDKKSVE